MKRNLNIKVKGRDGTEFAVAKGKYLTFADVIVASLDAFAQPGMSKREIGKLADLIDSNKKPAKETDIQPEDAKLIVAAMDAGPYVSIACNQIAKYLEAK